MTRNRHLTVDDEAIDRAMLDDVELAPSSGFVQAVMNAVVAERTAPPPIAFPWARVWPAAALCAVLTAGPLVLARPDLAVSTAPLAGPVVRVLSLLDGLVASAEVRQAAIGLALTWLLVDIPRRIVSRR